MKIYRVQIRFFEDGDDAQQEWKTVERYADAGGAYRRAVALESRNMANGADCVCRVVDEAGHNVAYRTETF